MITDDYLESKSREEIEQILLNMEPSYENLCVILEYDPILFTLFLKDPDLDPIKKKQWEEVLNELRASIKIAFAKASRRAN